MALMIGPVGAGKTLLLKRLQSCSNSNNFSRIDDAPATIPTVGTNLMPLATSKKSEVIVRELGGCMGPIWKNYFEDCKAVIYVMDICSKVQVSAGCVQLLDMLAHEKMQHVTILILLNKVDMPNALTRTELNALMQLDQIITMAKQTITVLETSALKGTGLQQIMKWIQKTCQT